MNDVAGKGNRFRKIRNDEFFVDILSSFRASTVVSTSNFNYREHIPVKLDLP